jgi:hypothetical protein
VRGRRGRAGARQRHGGAAQQHPGDRGAGTHDAHGDRAGPARQLDRAGDEPPVVGPLEGHAGVDQKTFGDTQQRRLVLADDIEGDGRLGRRVVASQDGVVDEGARAGDADARFGQTERQLQVAHAALLRWWVAPTGARPPRSLTPAAARLNTLCQGDYYEEAATGVGPRPSLRASCQPSATSVPRRALPIRVQPRLDSERAALDRRARQTGAGASGSREGRGTMRPGRLRPGRIVPYN